MCRAVDHADIHGLSGPLRWPWPPSPPHACSGSRVRSARLWAWLPDRRGKLAVAGRYMDVLAVGPDDEGIRSSVQVGMGGNRCRSAALAIGVLSSRCCKTRSPARVTDPVSNHAG